MTQPAGLPASPEIPPATWQITSYCFWCSLSKNVVVIQIHSDWRARCIYYERYSALKSEREKRKMLDKCPGPTCHYVIDYRDKLIQEQLATK